MNTAKYALTLLVIGISVSSIGAQEICVDYALVPETTYLSKPVTHSQLVTETVMKPQTVTTWKPVWTRETRERRTTVLKPIVQTSEREERYLVRRPIVETSYRERQVEETSYETVTEMREQRWLVEKPVVETQYREEQVVVRKPVTSTVMQTENVTTLKPVTVNETQLVPGLSVGNELALETGRNRLRWLRPGTYVDPNTGLAQYRRRGLHWVPDQQLAIRPTVEPTLVQQNVARTTYVPETIQTQKPVQVTRYVDQYETRKVPVQVSRTDRSIEVTRTPVTVQKPVTRIRTEKVPVEEVKYREEILTRRVPVTETKYQRVEQVEPYEVEVCKWVAETKQINVPQTVTRRVDYTMDQVVPIQTLKRVPIDAWGNPIPALTQSRQVVRRPVSERLLSAPVTETYRPLPENTSSSNRNAVGDPIIVRKLGDDEYREPDQQNRRSIMVPESGTSPNRPSSPTTEVRRPTLATDAANQISDRKNQSPVADTIPELQPIEAPSAGDVDRDSSLRVDSTDAADIDSRPGSQPAGDSDGPSL